MILSNARGLHREIHTLDALRSLVAGVEVAHALSAWIRDKVQTHRRAGNH